MGLSRNYERGRSEFLVRFLRGSKGGGEGQITSLKNTRRAQHLEFLRITPSDVIRPNILKKYVQRIM